MKQFPNENRSNLLHSAIRTPDYWEEQVWKNPIETVRFLLEKGVIPRQGDLFEAVKSNTWEVVQLFLKHGCSVDEQVQELLNEPTESTRVLLDFLSETGNFTA
jgi:hypothetical protein